MASTAMLPGAAAVGSMTNSRPVEAEHSEGLRVGRAADVHGVVALAAVDGRCVDVARATAKGRDEDVVAGAAEETDRPRTADQRVATAAPEKRRRRGPVREDAVRLVDAHAIVAAACEDDDGVERVAVERGVGRAVVVEIDLDVVGDARLEAQRDVVGAGVARHAELGAVHLGRAHGRGIIGGEPGRGGHEGPGGEHAHDRAATDHRACGEAGHAGTSFVAVNPLRQRRRALAVYSLKRRNPRVCGGFWCVRWRRWESNPRPQPRKETASTSVAGALDLAPYSPTPAGLQGASLEKCPPIS